MQERLERLERQVRWTRAGLVLVGLAALASWTRPDREVVQVRDAEGRVRIELGWNEVGQPGVFLYDEDGQERAAFEITRSADQHRKERTPRIVLRDLEGHRAVELAHVDETQHGSTDHLRFYQYDVHEQTEEHPFGARAASRVGIGVGDDPQLVLTGPPGERHIRIDE